MDCADARYLRAKDLGPSGEKHEDEDDHPAALSGAGNGSDLPLGVDVGTFYMSVADGSIVLNPWVFVLFSGLHSHVGSDAIAKPGQIWRKWALRFNVILYPSKFLLTGQNTLAIAPAPANNLQVLRPEHHSIA